MRGGWESVENWLGRLGDTTARNYRYNFDLFMKWKTENGGQFSNYTPDEMLEYQRNSNNGTVFDMLDLAQRWILSLNEKTKNTRVAYLKTVRSFFLHNRCELPRDKSFIIRGDVEPVNGGLSPENIRDMVLASKPRYRAIWLSMFQGALGLEEWDYWNQHGLKDLRDQLRKNPDLVIIRLPGRKKFKNERQYHTYIGQDAIQAIRDYFKVRPKNEKTIFLNQSGTPLSRDGVQLQWLRTAKRIGLVEPVKNATRGTRYGAGIHELRDSFRTLWSKSGASQVVAEHLMGHVGDRYGYDKSPQDEDFTRMEYLKASRFLNVMSSERPYNLLDESVYEAQNVKIRELESIIAKMSKEREAFVEIKTDEIYNRIMARVEADAKAKEEAEKKKEKEGN